MSDRLEKADIHSDCMCNIYLYYCALWTPDKDRYIATAVGTHRLESLEELLPVVYRGGHVDLWCYTLLSSRGDVVRLRVLPYNNMPEHHQVSRELLSPRRTAPAEHTTERLVVVAAAATPHTSVSRARLPLSLLGRGSAAAAFNETALRCSVYLPSV